MTCVDGDLGHGEVDLGQLGSLHVEADEDLGNRLNVEVFRQFDEASVVVDNLRGLWEDLAYGFAVGLRMARDIAVGKIYMSLLGNSRQHADHG
jgi:hypothetical protein